MTTKIDAIRPYEKNPRKVEDAALDKLAESIKRDPQFMVLRPIVVDGEGIILGGNQRWRACKEKLKLKELPDGWVVRADDLTEEQRKRFVLADNKQAGEWDFDVLAENWDAGELESFGFDIPDEKESSHPTHEVTEEIRPINRAHVLISMSVDVAAEIMPQIERLANAHGAEVHHAGN